jgi:hypothetical protein
VHGDKGRADAEIAESLEQERTGAIRWLQMISSRTEEVWRVHFPPTIGYFGLIALYLERCPLPKAI